MNEGGIKHDTEKLRTDLIPTSLIKAVATILTFGCKKYGDRNWEKGLKWSRAYGAIVRHLIAWMDREEYDHESGKSHLWHAATELAFLIEFEETHRELDDRPKTKTTENPVVNNYPIHSPEYIRSLQNAYSSEGPIAGGKIGYENGTDTSCGHRKCKVSYRNPTGECLIEKNFAPTVSPCTLSDATGFSG